MMDDFFRALKKAALVTIIVAVFFGIVTCGALLITAGHTVGGVAVFFVALFASLTCIYWHLDC